MDYTFTKMTQEQAEEIAFNWHYPGEYRFYDMEADKEDLVEFLDPDSRGDAYYIVQKGGKLIGFFNFYEKQNNTIELGLGMKPEFTGKGMGLGFLKAGLDFAKTNFNPAAITLSVAAFNKRAIKLYEKTGFVPIKTFIQETNGGKYSFVSMLGNWVHSFPMRRKLLINNGNKQRTGIWIFLVTNNKPASSSLRSVKLAGVSHYS
ncbi:ribosomal-protein-alanine N-acetyltransferase [Sediminibacillus albus]|uniref:Ribosomal-protein-alanine N-acetyltransferase n=1 Tax=Sediminibacillus albus TaxID=407036 RepID=A0A1G8WKE4_9BACI|nr:ribosomal-protein-alanine N-acetyltransferase [Sediminibacillus albus]